MAEFLQTIESFLQDNSFLGNGTSSCVFFLFKFIEYLLTFLFVFIGEEESAMSLEILRDPKGVWLVGILLISSERHSNDFVLSHKELGVSQGLSERFEVIGAHIVEGKDVQIPVFLQKVVDLIDDELFMLSNFGLDLGQRNNFIFFGKWHQQ